MRVTAVKGIHTGGEKRWYRSRIENYRGIYREGGKGGKDRMRQERKEGE